MIGHAVRWSTRGDGFGGLKYGKWHWTTDENFTICGLVIRLANTRGSFLPDTDDMIERVDCVHCIRKLEDTWER